MGLIVHGDQFYRQYEVLSWFKGQERLSVHTKIVLISTTSSFSPGLSYFICLKETTSLGCPCPDKILTSFFQSVTPGQPDSIQ
jgi:hypothetical protein